MGLLPDNYESEEAPELLNCEHISVHVCSINAQGCSEDIKSLLVPKSTAVCCTYILCGYASLI